MRWLGSHNSRVELDSLFHSDRYWFPSDTTRGEARFIRHPKGSRLKVFIGGFQDSKRARIRDSEWVNDEFQEHIAGLSSALLFLGINAPADREQVGWNRDGILVVYNRARRGGIS